MGIVTICQRKGGNGKSTLALNLAAAFAEQRRKILLIDLDDQRNTTSTIPTKRPAAYTVEDLLFDPFVSVEKAAEETWWPNIDLIAGSRTLSAATAQLDGMANSHNRLLKKLIDCRKYDYCFIDTSPSLNMLTINALCASYGVIIPLSSNYYSLEGLAQTLEAYRHVKEKLGKKLSLYGAAFVIHDGRTRLANEVQAKVKEQYPELVCETVIGRNIKIEEAQVKKQSIFQYAPEDRGAEQYRALARELALRMALL